MQSHIRTRFAPSPTGYLHIGGLRTALFNWLWARQHQGLFILRLEDTDQSRLVAQAADNLLKDLKSLGLSWDFGPDKAHPQFGSCIQSQRLEIYQQMAETLVEKKIAYYDYTPSETLQALRQKAQKEKKAFIFRKDLAQQRPIFANQKPVVRLALPENQTISWRDVVKGWQSWQTKDIGDFIILKSDGWPVYHFASVIDDHLMKISHVIRADEWLSSTPKHLYLYQIFNWQAPQFVHIPPVLMPQGGQKISKREGANRISEILKEGYMPEALLNYLALLGWNPKSEQEFFSINQLIRKFKIEQIQVSGARFDSQRLDWFNGKHIRTLSKQERQRVANKWWSKPAEGCSQKYKNQVLDLVYERLKKWSDLAQITSFFFKKPTAVAMADLEKSTKLTELQIKNILEQTINLLNNSDFTTNHLESELYRFATSHQLTPSKYFSLLRLKITGEKVAPGLFETMQLLGRQTVLERLKN